MNQIMRFTLILVFFALAGCANTKGVATNQVGSFLQANDVDTRRLAADSVQQLAALFPPARTRFDLQQSTPDAFGQALVSGLREKGFAVQEFAPAGAGPTASAPSTGAPNGRPLSYVLDHAGEGGLYRLALLMGNQTMTRAYVGQGGALSPAGQWVRKE